MLSSQFVRKKETIVSKRLISIQVYVDNNLPFLSASTKSSFFAVFMDNNLEEIVLLYLRSEDLFEHDS